MILWLDGAIFITNFESSLTISNARDLIVDDVRIIDLVFHIYAAENGLMGNTIIDGEQQIQLIAKIPFSQIIPGKMAPEDKTFEILIGFLQQYFFNLQFAMDDSDHLIVILKYNNDINLQERLGLKPMSYKIIKQIIKNLESISKPDNE